MKITMKDLHKTDPSRLVDQKKLNKIFRNYYYILIDKPNDTFRSEEDYNFLKIIYSWSDKDNFVEPVTLFEILTDLSTYAKQNGNTFFGTSYDLGLDSDIQRLAKKMDQDIVDWIFPNGN